MTEPTEEQRALIAEYGMAPDEWLVESLDQIKLVLVRRDMPQIKVEIIVGRR